MSELFTPELLRKPIRRCIRIAIQIFPLPFIKELVSRVPYSRYHNIAKDLFWGIELIEYYGVSIKVNPGDNQGYYAYFLQDYEGQVIRKLIELCQDCKAFADIGANFGWISLAIAQNCGMISVYSFEPDGHAINGFKDNLERNIHLSKRIHIINKAVGDKNGVTSFLYSIREGG